MHEQWSAKFWARVQKSDASDGCWLWSGSRLPKGYGRFYPAFRVGLYAHRVAWEIANGRGVPDGLHVMHSCDTPRCVNPAHLSVGTRSDNMQDCVAKKRNGAISKPWSVARGERNPNAKLTQAQVDEIRRRLASGESRHELAAEFGVTKCNVRFIAVGISWRAA